MEGRGIPSLDALVFFFTTFVAVSCALDDDPVNNVGCCRGAEKSHENEPAAAVSLVDACNSNNIRIGKEIFREFQKSRNEIYAEMKDNGP